MIFCFQKYQQNHKELLKININIFIHQFNIMQENLNQLERFNRLNAEGGCGYQGHWRYLQVEKDGEKKQVLIENGKKTIQQMLQEMENQEKMSNKKESGIKQPEKHVQYQALINDKEGTLKLNKKMQISELLDLGIQKIELQKASSKKYPDIQSQSSLINNYFNAWEEQSKQKQIKQTINLIIYFQGQKLFLKFNLNQKVQVLKEKIKQSFQIQKNQMKVTYENKSLEFDDKALKYYSLKDNSQVHVMKVKCIAGEKSIIKIQCSDIHKESIEIKLMPSMLIEQLLQDVAAQLKISVMKIKLFKGNVQLNPMKSLKDYGVQKGNTLFLKYGEPQLVQQPPKSQVVKMVEIKTMELNTIKFPYQTIKNKSVKEVIGLINTKNRPYFCLLYGKLLLKPHNIINQIQKEFIFKSSAVVIGMKIISSVQKSLFYSEIIDPFGSIFDLENKQKLNTRQAKKLAISNYRNFEYNNQINDFICKFVPGAKKIPKFQKTEEKLQQLLNVFIKMEDYKSQMAYDQLFKIPVMQYDCVKRQRYSKFNLRHKIGDCFYWREFTSTKITTESIQLQNGGMYETVYLIRSLTGKQIGKISKIDGNEVVFLPFTYFVVDHIVVDKKQEAEVQIIYLSQMPTPFTLDKSIELWVDDDPSSNSLISKKIMEENTQIEVLQILNTKTLQIWMSEFSWIFNWAQLKLKVITDMIRVQANYSCKNSIQIKDKKSTYVKFEKLDYAGVTVVQNLHKIAGYTVPTCVFCKNKQEAQKKLQQRGISGKIYYQLSNNPTAIKEFGQEID